MTKTEENVSDRETLLNWIKELAIVHGKVTLSSGLESDYYIDMRRLTLHAKAAPLIGRVMLELTKDWDYQVAGGLTLGADPVAISIMYASAGSIDACVVRKAGKAHGMQQRIEGPSVVGRRVLVVEDISTTGGSPLTAVEALREAGAEVVGAAMIADRGGVSAVEAVGVPCRAAYSLGELGLA